MSSIGSILTAKELTESYQTLLMCQFELVDGSMLYFSTHPLSPGYGGSPTSGSYAWNGQDWIPRILNQDISATQAMSDLGADIVPQMVVLLADPDRTVFAAELAVGFKGAILTVYATMWDAANTVTGSFSSDTPSIVKFIGTCSAATSIDQRTISITATSLLNMTQQQVPPVRVQPTCPYIFPSNPTEQFDAMVNIDSPSYSCGYSYGISPYAGIQPVGNPQPGTTAAFTFCDLSRQACIDRLGDDTKPIPIIQDQFGQPTGRYGGFDFVPIQNVGLQRPYITGQWQLIINSTNQARYGDYSPLAYGVTWTTPLILGVYGDSNYTRFEALLCYTGGKPFPPGWTAADDAGRIHTVVVNGDVVGPLTPNGSVAGISLIKTNYNFWAWLNEGGRNGSVNGLIGWSNKGDPYGSNSAMVFQVLASLAASSSLPEVQILGLLNAVQTYSDPSTSLLQYSRNPAWILMDLLIQCNWRYSQMNIASFIAAAAVCDENISFNSVSGNYQNFYNESGSPLYTRYSVGFSLQQRSSIGDVIRGLRNAMRAMLFFDFQTGLLTIQCKQTLAEQQPSPISGSNYNVPVRSMTAAGVIGALPAPVGGASKAGWGYVAYLFDGSSILKDSQGRSTLKVSQLTYNNTPNKTTNYFFDRENSYSQDTSVIIDVEDVARVGAEISCNFNLIGPQTFDHINRVTATFFAENYRGNPRLDYQGSAQGDTGGTYIAELETTVKGIHLMVGQICLLTDVQNGIDQWEMRITRIQPSTNFETAKITCQYHNSAHYCDTYGQGSAQPIYISPRSAPQGKPRNWLPDYELPQTGDVYHSLSEATFGLAQYYATDGSVANIDVTGVLPINSSPTVPLAPQLEFVGIGNTGGGYPSGTAYFTCVSAVGIDGTLSPPSNVCSINLSPSQNALDFVAQAWPSNAVSGFVSFAGLRPETMCAQTSASVTAAFVQLTNNFKIAAWAPPDNVFSQFQLNLRKEVHPGTFTANILSVTTASIQLVVPTNYGFSTNQWAGREVSVLGVQFDDVGDPAYVPVANFPISSSTPDELILSAGDPTTCVDGRSLSPGDVVCVRLKPTFGSDSTGNYFEDAQLVNCLNPLSMQYTVSNATNASPIVVSIPNDGNPFPFANGDTLVLQDSRGNTAANGAWIAASVDSTNFQVTLTGSTGNANYAGGGTIAKQVQGLVPNGEVGNVAFIVAGSGKGTSAKIASNTATRCYVVGDWPITPDPTSRVIILDSVLNTQMLSHPISNSQVGLVQSFTADVSAYGKDQSIFVQVRCISTDGTHKSYSALDPFREIYLFGEVQYFDQPGDVNAPVFFDATSDMTQSQGYQLWIAASGGEFWGGCNLWVSRDGVNFTENGQQLLGRCVTGVLTGALPTHVDPDIVDVLAVDLTQSLGQLAPAFSQADYDNFKCLCVVDQELIAYKNSTQTGAHAYGAGGSSGSPLHRGAYGTTPNPHLVGAQFAQIRGGPGAGPIVFVYEPSDVGQTLWFKFTSFNLGHNLEQDVSGVTAYPFYIAGNASRLPYGPNGGDETPLLLDPLFSQGMFTLQPQSNATADGSVDAGALVGPQVPVTNFSQVIAAPVLNPTVAVSASGGSLPGPQTLYLALAGVDSSGGTTELSNVVVANIPSGTTASVVLTLEFWDTGSASFALYAGTFSSQQLGFISLPTAGGTVTVTTVTPTSVSYPIPDPVFDHFAAQTTQVLLDGIFSGPLDLFSHTLSVNTFTFVGTSFGSLTGRVLSDLQPQGGYTPLIDYLITSNTGTTILTGRPHGRLPRPSTSFNASPGDWMVVRLQPNIFTGLTIGDSALAMTPSQYQKNVVRVFYADGTNQTSFIIDNTSTTCTVASAFNRGTPVWWWIESGLFNPSVSDTAADAALLNNGGTGLFPTIPNVAGSYAVQVLASDAFGNLSISDCSPIREFYYPGDAGTARVANPGYRDVTMNGSNQFVLDIGGGGTGAPMFDFRITLTTATVTGTPPDIVTQASIPGIIWTGGPAILPGIPKVTLYIDQDSDGAWPIPSAAVGIGGFTIDVGQLQLAPDTNTRSTLLLTCHAGPIWALNTFRTGGAIS